MVRVFPHEAQVMADQQDGHMMGMLEIQQGIQEHFQAVTVDTADGFIQHQQVRRGIHGQGEQHALQLTA